MSDDTKSYQTLSDDTKPTQTATDNTKPTQTVTDGKELPRWRKALKRTKRCLGLFAKKFFHDWSVNMAGMLSYYLLIAIVPMGVAIYGIVGLIFRNNPEMKQKAIDNFYATHSSVNLSSSSSAEVASMVTDSMAGSAGLVLFLGIIFAIFGAAQFFVALERVFTIIFRFPERTFARRNLLAMGMVLIFIVLFPLLAAVSSVGTVSTVHIDNAGTRFGVELGGFLLSVLVAFFLFEIIYWIVPNKKMRFRTTWVGALFASITLQLVLIWYPTYVQKHADTSAGVVGMIFLFIALLYYFSIILIMGAEINSFCIEHYLPYEEGLGTCLSEMYHHDVEGGSMKPLLAGYPDDKKPLISESTDTLMRLVDKNVEPSKPSVDESAESVPLKYEQLN